jgi:hypothetical protein
VYKAVMDGVTLVAVKVLPLLNTGLNRLQRSDGPDNRYVLREVAILRSCRQRNIVQVGLFCLPAGASVPGVLASKGWHPYLGFWVRV